MTRYFRCRKGHLLFIIMLLPVLMLAVSCRDKAADKSIVTPWGEVMTDSVSAGGFCSISEIVSNGELIVVTLSGPQTYFEYHGRGFGTQYLLCEKFAQQLGVALRVEVCKDTAELAERVRQGSADLIMCMLPKGMKQGGGLKFCGAYSDGMQWAVAKATANWRKPLTAGISPRCLPT